MTGVKWDIENVSDVFSIQNGLRQEGSSWPLLFILDLECAIKKMQENYREWN
jgi:hypothetical protein